MRGEQMGWEGADETGAYRVGGCCDAPDETEGCCDEVGGCGNQVDGIQQSLKNRK